MQTSWFIKRRVTREGVIYEEFLQVISQWQPRWGGVVRELDWLPSSAGATEYATPQEAHRAIKLNKNEIDALGGKVAVGRSEWHRYL